MKNKIEKDGRIYDFNRYYDLKDMIGYNGFITPDGGFYKVRPIDNTKEELLKHEQWAGEWLRSQNISLPAIDEDEYNAMAYIILEREKKFFDYSINSLRIDLEMPQSSINFSHLTTKQKEILKKKMELELKEEIIDSNLRRK